MGSFGIYANFADAAALHGTWQREDPAIAQAEIDALPRETVATVPEGTGVVETYAVRYGRKGPEMTVVIGKLVDGPNKGHRFVANTPNDPTSLQQFVDGDPIGAHGDVRVVKGKGVFKSSSSWWPQKSLISFNQICSDLSQSSALPPENAQSA